MRAKARRRMASPDFGGEAGGKVFSPRPRRADLRVNLERADGGRVQFTAHFFGGKLVGQNFQLSPKQFGRRLGKIFQLWMQP